MRKMVGPDMAIGSGPDGCDHLRQYRSFKKARAFVRGLGLKSVAEWREYCQVRQEARDIPANPDQTYAKDGWAGTGDWLGTGRVAPWRQYRPFNKARAFVHGLGLKSHTQWREYCKSGKKPEDIPAAPNATYAKDGWTGWGDWLGTGRVANQFRQYRPFKKARVFVRGLGLKSVEEWTAYCKSGKKPEDIPAYPRQTYLNVGWAGHGDWLGYERKGQS